MGKEGGLHDAMLGPRGGGIGIHLLSSTFSCVVFSLSWGCDVEVASVASGTVSLFWTSVSSVSMLTAAFSKTKSS